MAQELTDKTMVVVSRLGDFWVNPKMAQTIITLKQSDPHGAVNFEGSLVSLQSIDGVVTAEQYEIINNKRRGAWQCKYRWWHEKFQQCAHTKYNPKG